MTSNWCGQPLTSHELVVSLIGATTTRTELDVHAQLDEGTYPSGVNISDGQTAPLRPTGASRVLRRLELHGPATPEAPYYSCVTTQ